MPEKVKAIFEKTVVVKAKQRFKTLKTLFKIMKYN